MVNLPRNDIRASTVGYRGRSHSDTNGRRLQGQSVSIKDFGDKVETVAGNLAHSNGGRRGVNLWTIGNNVVSPILGHFESLGDFSGMDWNEMILPIKVTIKECCRLVLEYNYYSITTYLTLE